MLKMQKRNKDMRIHFNLNREKMYPKLISHINYSLRRVHPPLIIFLIRRFLLKGFCFFRYKLNLGDDRILGVYSSFGQNIHINLREHYKGQDEDKLIGHVIDTINHEVLHYSIFLIKNRVNINEEDIIESMLKMDKGVISV